MSKFSTKGNACVGPIHTILDGSSDVDHRVLKTRYSVQRCALCFNDVSLKFESQTLNNLFFSPRVGLSSVNDKNSNTYNLNKTTKSIMKFFKGIASRNGPSATSRNKSKMADGRTLNFVKC